MSWDEKLFGWAWRRGRELLAPRESPEVLARRATLAPLVDRLRAVAIATAGRALTIREAEAEGGVGPGVVLLPGHLDFAGTREDNERAYLLRAVLAASVLGLELVPREPLSDAERVLATAMAFAAARVRVQAELPGATEDLARLSDVALRARPPGRGSLDLVLRAMVAGTLEEEPPRDADGLVARARSLAPAHHGSPMPAPFPLWGWLAPREAATLLSGDGHDPKNLPRGTEISAKRRDRVRQKQLDPRPQADNPLVHSFEKLHTLEEHAGGKKQLDGSDEIEAHAEALKELDLREVVRSDEQTSSLMRVDAMFESGGGELAGEAVDGIPYDEWNEPARVFRPGWCRVRVAPVVEKTSARAAETEVGRQALAARPRIDAVRAELARLELARRPRARQLDGPDVDDDAMVDRHAALAARATPPDRLYRSLRRHSPDLAVLLLVDASLSTDGWIEGQRVLDVERDATLVLAEALSGRVDELGIAAFSSHTRADCRFIVVKGMREEWTRARHRLASLEPAGYTRIGPALRHGTTVLERCAARRRLLLLVTDGKPNDFDRYEGRYGIADVAHAVLEADGRGVHVHALAMDREARHHLPRMFRAGGFSLLRGPAELARSMGDVVARMQR